jgi:hypothetical protein
LPPAWHPGGPMANAPVGVSGKRQGRPTVPLPSDLASSATTRRRRRCHVGCDCCGVAIQRPPNENQVPGPRAARDDGKCRQRARIHSAPCRGTLAATCSGPSDPRVGAARSTHPFIRRYPPARACPLRASPPVRSCQRSRFNPRFVGRRYGALAQHECDGGESGDRGRWLQGRQRARPWIGRRVEGQRVARSNRSAAERWPDGQGVGKLIDGVLPLLVLAFGTAMSIATTKALQDWAVAKADIRTSTGDLLAVAPSPAAHTRR